MKKTELSQTKHGHKKIMPESLQPYVMWAEQYIGKIWRICLSLTNSPESAETLCHKVFTHARACNKIIDSEEQRKLRLLYEFLIRACKKTFDTEAENTDALAALAQLPTDQAIALALYYYEEMNIGEIAETLQIEPNAAQELLRIARRTLNNLLIA